MIDIDNMSSKTLIKEQYKNTDNLKLRKGLHDKYSVKYIYSMASMQGLEQKFYDVLLNYFNSKKENGYGTNRGIY